MKGGTPALHLPYVCICRRGRTVGHASDSPGNDYTHYYKLESRSYRNAVSRKLDRYQQCARHGGAPLLAQLVEARIHRTEEHISVKPRHKTHPCLAGVLEIIPVIVMLKKPFDFLIVLLIALGPCSASRSLQQSADNSQDISIQAPAAQPVRSNIQLSAPGTSELLNAPAFAPTSEPLPAGVVSLAAKRNSNGAATANGQDDQQSFTYTTMPVHTSPASSSIRSALLKPRHA